MARPLVPVTIVAAVATLACQVWIGGAASLASLFTLWILLPAFVTLAIALRSSARQTALWCAVMALPLALGLGIYVMAGLGPSDAQIGLVFLFVPIWQLVALAIAAGIAWFIVRRQRAQASRS
jgi:hypothetical protein